MRLIFASLILCLAVTRSTAEDFNVERYIADGAVMLFWNACVKFYPNPKEFDTWIESNSFELLPEKQADRLTQEKGGKVYSVNNNGVRYLLVTERTNLCTVLVKEVNLDFAGQAFDAWQEGLKTKGWVEFDSMTIDKKVNSALRTTSYKYGLLGEEVLNIVMSEAIGEAGFYQLAMSASMQRGANHSYMDSLRKSGE